MYKVYQVMPVPKWTIDGKRVIGPHGEALDMRGEYTPTMDAKQFTSCHGREQIAVPQSDDIVVVTTGSWTSLPVKAGLMFVQLFMGQNLDLGNPTMQRFAFRTIEVADTEEELQALLQGIPEFDLFGKLKAGTPLRPIAQEIPITRRADAPAQLPTE